MYSEASFKQNTRFHIIKPPIYIYKKIRLNMLI